MQTAYDLVVLSYTLFELPSTESRKGVLLNLWKKCNGYFVIVDEGTRRGSELVNEARDFILNIQSEELKGSVFSPVRLPLERLFFLLELNFVILLVPTQPNLPASS